MKYISVDQISGLQDLQIDGVLGLGPESKANTVEYTNFVSQLHKQGQIKFPRFSIFLSKTGIGSRLLIGDFSQGTQLSSTYNLMSYCTSKTNEWGCDLDSISIEKETLPLSSTINFDSGSSYLYIPISDYKFIKKYLIDQSNSECILSENKQIHCKCESPQRFNDITLTINKKNFIIKTTNLIDFFPTLTYQCRFEIIIDYENLDTWVLGASAMKNNLFSFDLENKKIGFVQEPKEMESLLYMSEMPVQEEENTGSKIGYIFVLAFIGVLMFGVYKFANNEEFFKFNSSERFSSANEDDQRRAEELRNRFREENSTDNELRDNRQIINNNNNNKEGNRYIEMKDTEEKEEEEEIRKKEIK